MAVRSKTLPAAIAPVLMGTAMAYEDGSVHWSSAFLCMTAAIFIQIGTNLANDYFDCLKGADAADRIGPTRVTQAGLIKPEIVLAGFVISFLIAAIASVFLIARGGWPLALIGVFSILSGIFYTAGPYPLGYLGLGEIFVLIFFGPVAVAGTYYVQTLEIHPPIIVAGLGPGLLSAAILVVNNLRDIDGDRRAGKKTLAVRFGRSFAMSEYLGCVLLAGLIPVAVFLMTSDYVYSLLAALTMFVAIPTIKTVLTRTEGTALNGALAATGKLLLLYSVLFSIGWML